jgi:hypothetical protein
MREIGKGHSWDSGRFRVILADAKRMQKARMSGDRESNPGGKVESRIKQERRTVRKGRKNREE